MYIYICKYIFIFRSILLKPFWLKCRSYFVSSSSSPSSTPLCVGVLPYCEPDHHGSLPLADGCLEVCPEELLAWLSASTASCSWSLSAAASSTAYSGFVCGCMSDSTYPDEVV